MNFFKSVFSDDPDPQSPPSESPNPDTTSPTSAPPTTAPTTDTGGWNFALGGIIKTLSSKSETVLETYRRDLQEFSSGLKSETQLLKHVASSSLDLGAAKASVSLESVGLAFDNLGSKVADIISQGKDSLLSHDLDLIPPSDNINNNNNDNNNVSNVSVNSVKYSRFDAQLRAIQSDVSTFVEDPEDGEEFDKWKLGFHLDEFKDDAEALLGENGSVVGIYGNVVPSVVDRDLFWCRYFYRVHRLKQAEFVRAKLVKRAIEAEDEEEELSWDVDDDDVDEKEDEEVCGLGKKVSNVALGREKSEGDESAREISGKEVVETEAGGSEKKDEVVTRDVGDEKAVVMEAASEKASNEIEQVEEKAEVKEEDLVKKVEEKAALEGKREPSESGKDSDLSVVSSQPSHEEEDLGWDEIEDIGSGDEKKVSQLGSPNRAELRKRLSAAEDDEDLSWDIEDDDEPIKS